MVSSSVYIYCLRDPLTLDVRYVGRCNIPRKRLLSHIADANRVETRGEKVMWIRSLLEQGQRPIMEVIELVADGVRWQERECFWIADYRIRGANLTNATYGGEGSTGYKRTREQRRWLSLIKTARNKPWMLAQVPEIWARTKASLDRQRVADERLEAESLAKAQRAARKVHVQERNAFLARRRMERKRLRGLIVDS